MLKRAVVVVWAVLAVKETPPINKSYLTRVQATIATGQPIFRWTPTVEIATEDRALPKIITNNYTNMKDPKLRVSSGSNLNMSSNPLRPELSHLTHPTGSTFGA